MDREFVVCVADPNYEISTTYPHDIRRIGSKRNAFIKPKDNGCGYYQVCLSDGKYKYVHRIIAMQFIENDDPIHKTQVDHINRIRSDNRIENLRWVTASTNNRNKSGRNGVEYEFLDKLPDNCVCVNECCGNRFDNVYYCKDNNKCYYVDVNIRSINVYKTKFGREFVRLRNVDGKYKNVYLDDLNKL